MSWSGYPALQHDLSTESKTGNQTLPWKLAHSQVQQQTMYRQDLEEKLKKIYPSTSKDHQN